MFQEQNNIVYIDLNKKAKVSIPKPLLIKIFQNFLDQNFKDLQVFNLSIVNEKIYLVLKELKQSSTWINQYDKLLNKISNSIQSEFSIYIDSISMKL